MNLDELTLYEKIDPTNMLAEIDGLPDQLEAAWKLGHQLPLPEFTDVHHVLVAGMGGSAIGADILSAYIEPMSRVPVFVQRDYNLPAWAATPSTLLIASSHSGNTEETLAVFEQARKAGCQILCISTGGNLAALGESAGIPVWKFHHTGQPRAAVGYSFGLLLALFVRLGFIPEQDAEVVDALQAMRTQQSSIKKDIPTVKNPAKRQAGQMMDRWGVILGAGMLTPVARRWKGQLSELAKAWGQFEALPEADHNTLAGIDAPAAMLEKTIVIFLRAASDHSRNRLRSELTQKTFMVAGLGTDSYMAQGETRLAQLWTAIHFGDYTAYYLALSYGVDPTPIPAITSLKNAMQS